MNFIVRVAEYVRGLAHGRHSDESRNQEIWERMPPWAPPAECVDIAKETLRMHREATRYSHPEYLSGQVELVARERAMQDLERRADFRREISEYTNPH